MGAFPLTSLSSDEALVKFQIHLDCLPVVQLKRLNLAKFCQRMRLTVQLYLEVTGCQDNNDLSGLSVT
jgi:hypothetical protein